MTQEEICAIFARNLNRLMTRDGLKQSDIVAKLKVSKAQASDWCAGKNLPRSNYLAALIDLFGCRLSDLVSEKEPAPITESGLCPEDARIMDMICQLNPENKRKFAEKLETLIDFQLPDPDFQE